MREERNIALAVVFSIITCGIYSLYWFIVASNEVKEYCKDEQMMDGGLACVLTIVTCGIFGIYWWYNLGMKMQEAQKLHKIVPKDNAVLYLILSILGLSIVNQCLLQSDINEITRQLNGTGAKSAA